MAKELDVIGGNDPYLAARLKGYDFDELTSTSQLLIPTISWLKSLGFDKGVSEDVITLRAGVPYLGSDVKVDADAIYTGNGDIFMLVRSLGLDVFKVTVNNEDASQAPGNRMDSYTYKSKVIHQIFGKYFINGVDNRSGFAYLDSEDTGLSALASVPVRYAGVVQNTPAEHFGVPSYVIECLTYLVQNPRLFVIVGTDKTFKRGDLIHFNAAKFYDRLVETQAYIDVKLESFPGNEPPTFEETVIQKVFEATGMDSAFSDLEYGGLIDGLRVLLRVPASRDKQDVLERLLGEEEDFNSIFKEEWVTMSEDDATASAKDLDLADPYDENLNGFKIGDVGGGKWGCRRVVMVEDPNSNTTPPTYIEEVTYRHWMISDVWLNGLTAERLAIVFWEGLDMVSDIATPCPNDQILTIVLIIVMTIITVISLGSTAAAQSSATTVLVAQAIAITSAIISIGVTVGAIDPEAGGVALSILGVVSLFTLNFSSLLTLSLESINTVVQIVSAGFQLADAIENYQYQKEVDDLQDEIAAFEEQNAEFYESSIRMELGGYQNMHISNGAEMDYEHYLKDTYDKFSPNRGLGFAS